MTLKPLVTVSHNLCSYFLPTAYRSYLPLLEGWRELGDGGRGSYWLTACVMGGGGGGGLSFLCVEGGWVREGDLLSLLHWHKLP